MPFLGRGIIGVARAAVRPHQYRGLYELTQVFDDPGRIAVNYVLKKGTYPSQVRAVTPIGKRSLTLYSVEDLMTANEIFARKDYYVDERPRIVLDLGSNIGVSIAYFLSRNHDNYVYGYEPVPANVERLKQNLSDFEGRYEITAKAVDVEAGRVEFATDQSNRYGGIGRAEELRSWGVGVTTFAVECLEANTVIAGVIERHGKIDVLKIDIEGQEQGVLGHIPPTMLDKIEIIYSEGVFPDDLLADTHVKSVRGIVAKFVRRDLVGSV